jgi:uncharacterized lipoprotein YmbA
MTHVRNVLCLVAVLGALGGCGSSPPTNFYALSTTPPAEAAAPATAPGPPILVNAVEIPPVLDRPQLVRGAGSSRVAVSSRDRWAAPLGGMIRTVLAQDLRARLPAGAVLSSAEVNGGAPKRDLVVDIQEFRADDAGTVTLAADWSLLDGSSRAARPRHERIVVAGVGGGDPGSQAAAMSRALGQLADRIAAAAAKPGSTAARATQHRQDRHHPLGARGDSES